MRKIVYYVAVSLDGYISGPAGDISGFVSGGNGLDQYLNDLQLFDTVIMGRKTYEFGYRFGLEPGKPAYPHMQHYIFSEHLQLPSMSPNVHIKPLQLSEIDRIQQQHGSDIYLCGGGEFAGWLLDHQRIDILKLKINPLILGSGVKLFGSSSGSYKTELLQHELYDHGLQIVSYKLKY